MNLAQTNFRALLASMRSMHRVPLGHMTLDRYAVPMELAHDPALSGTRTPKECFANCARIVSRYPDTYMYCEGIACSPSLMLPIDHAWLLRRDGKVIDPTWKHSDAHYYGIAFDVEGLADFSEESGVYGILDSAYLWGRGMSVAETQARLTQRVVRGLECAEATTELRAPTLQHTSATVYLPAEPLAVRDAYDIVRSSFLFDSVVIESDSADLRCTVAGHDADYLQKQVISCLQSKPTTFSM